MWDFASSVSARSPPASAKGRRYCSNVRRHSVCERVSASFLPEHFSHIPPAHLSNTPRCAHLYNILCLFTHRLLQEGPVNSLPYHPKSSLAESAAFTGEASVGRSSLHLATQHALPAYTIRNLPDTLTKRRRWLSHSQALISQRRHDVNRRRRIAIRDDVAHERAQGSGARQGEGEAIQVPVLQPSLQQVGAQVKARTVT